VISLKLSVKGLGSWAKSYFDIGTAEDEFEDDSKDTAESTEQKPSVDSTSSSKENVESQKTLVSCSLVENENRIRQIFDKCHDLVVREAYITNNPVYPVKIFHLTNMIEKSVMETDVIKKLTDPPSSECKGLGAIEYVRAILGISSADVHENFNMAADTMLDGNAVVFIEGSDKLLVVKLKSPPGRSVEEPSSEKVVRGPREGLVEDINTNIALVRKKIKSVDLKMEFIKLGRQSRTEVVICYMSNIVDMKIVEEVKKRLGEIDIDSVLDANYVGEYIQDAPVNLIPTIYRTEKPDVVAGKVLEGRVAIIVDGTPTVLTVPSVFSEFMMTSEDYYQNPILVSVLRMVRYIAFYLALTVPGVYVSLITFHSELLPSQLVDTIVRARTGVPFSAFVESFLMILTFTILQEADIRIPKTMGQAVSIVGALVLGEAAVQAGIVSSSMVIVAAFSGIASLAIPSPEMQLSLIHLRFIVLFSSLIFGLFGVTCVLLVMFMYLVSQRCFGVPYLTPVSPIDGNDLGDVFIRTPLWRMKKRPSFYAWKSSTRRKGRKTG
jgi:hypothetical protein